MSSVRALKLETRETYRSHCLDGIQKVVGCAIKFLCIFPRYDDNPVVGSWDLKNWVLQ